VKKVVMAKDGKVGNAKKNVIWKCEKCLPFDGGKFNQNYLPLRF
jgi:hypothetical protein